MRLPVGLREARDDGRLILRSPFGPEHRRVTAKLAEQRNAYVLELASAALFIHAAPGGRTEAVARAAIAQGKPVFTLASPHNANLVALGAAPVDVGDVVPRLGAALKT